MNFALNLKQKKVVGHRHNLKQGNAAGFNDREIMECFHLISLLGERRLAGTFQLKVFSRQTAAKHVWLESSAKSSRSEKTARR